MIARWRHGRRPGLVAMLVALTVAGCTDDGEGNALERIAGNLWDGVRDLFLVSIAMLLVATIVVVLGLTGLARLVRRRRGLEDQDDAEALQR